MIKLDLRYNRLNPEFSQLFNEIAINSRAQFTRLIDEMSEKYSNNLDWWVEGPSSRNNLASPLYHYFCGLHLLDLLLKNEYLISEIITDSFAYNKIIKEYLNKNDFKIRLKNNNNVLISFVKKSLMFIFSFFRELYKSLYHFWCAHKTINLKAPLPDMPLILIDVLNASNVLKFVILEP